MPAGDMRDRLREADEKAQVSAVGRMPRRGWAALARVAFQTLGFGGIVFPGFADVVEDAARHDDVAVDRHIRIEGGEFVRNGNGEPGDATNVVRLVTPF